MQVFRQAGCGIPIYRGEGTKIPFKWYAQDPTENSAKALMYFGPAMVLDNSGITVSAYLCSLRLKHQNLHTSKKEKGQRTMTFFTASCSCPHLPGIHSMTPSPPRPGHVFSDRTKTPNSSNPLEGSSIILPPSLRKMSSILPPRATFSSCMAHLVTLRLPPRGEQIPVTCPLIPLERAPKGLVELVCLDFRDKY